MQSFIRKWGNSNGIRLSKDVLTSVGLKCNDKVDISVVGDSLIITKSGNRKRRYANLQDRLESYYGKPLDEIYIPSESE